MLFWHVPAPNEALLISGSKRQKDGAQFRIVTGHGSFVTPVKQKARMLSLALREAEIVEECITNQGIRLNVRAVAAFKVGDDQASIANAARRFLSEQDRMEVLVGRVFAGHLRSIIGGLTVEQIIRERDRVAQEVKDGSHAEMEKLGIVVDALEIQEIEDSSGYINNLAAPHAAAVASQARIAKARADQEATERELAAASMKAQFERDMALKRAGFLAETEEANARAAQAGPLAEAQASQQVIQHQTALAQRQAELAAQRLEAEVRRPADAEAYRKRTLAEAERDQARFAAEAEAFSKRAIAEAEAEANKARAASLREGNQELIAANRIVEILPALVEAAARGLAESNLTILNGTQGVNEVVAGLLGQGLSILDTLKKTTTVTGNGASPVLVPRVPGRPSNGADLPRRVLPRSGVAGHPPVLWSSPSTRPRRPQTISRKGATALPSSLEQTLRAKEHEIQAAPILDLAAEAEAEMPSTVQTPVPDAATARAHPLEPLSAAEIEAAAKAVVAAAGLRPSARFVYISLYEPAKAEVVAFEAGGPAPERLVKVVIRERAERATYEGIVAVNHSELRSWRRVPGVQPSVMFEEFLAAEEAVRADPRWQEAMRRRGVTDFSLCMIDPWSSPNLAPELGPEDGRFVRPLTFVRSSPDDNGYARPVEGLVTLVDLDTMTIVDVEDHGVVPLPTSAANYSAEALTAPGNVPVFSAGQRQDVRPLDIVQADGPSFTIDGHHLRWQKWDLRIGFTAREGLVLHRIGYHDGGALRSVIHRASLSEMFVPYGDPAATHYRKLVLDEGEYGIGLLTNSLELGCDCLGEIRYLDGVVNDNDGKAFVVPNAICLHEEDSGIAWKHTDFRTGYVEVRRMRRMVISSIVTVGNYEYAYYWYLYQDGSIEYQVKLTGVISTGAVPPGTVPGHGTLVAPGVYGPHHQHFFNVRLDMAVDGPANRVYEVSPVALPEGPDNPVGNAWRAEEVLIESEAAGGRSADPLGGRYWKVVNNHVPNELGHSPGYKLVPDHSIAAFCHPGSPVARRAAFITRQLWVTAYDRDEMFATGDYPNQSAGGGGLPAYIQADRPLVDTDVVLWYTFGTHHVVRPEDWPVMPAHPIGFRLVPCGFFAGNPALDNPAPSHCHH